MVDCPFALDERISLTKAIFSNREETEAVKNLHGNDAQSFVNILDEVLLHNHPSLKDKVIELNTDLFIWQLDAR